MTFSRREVCASLGAALFLPRHVLAGSGRRGDPEALLGAVRAGDLATVDRLLAADPALARAIDATGRSAFVLAFVHGHPAIAERLRTAGLELDVVESVLAQDWDRFDELAAQDPAALLRAHPIGGTPLHAAAIGGIGGLWRLRAAGCVPDLVPDGGNGFTAARTATMAAHSHWARIALADLCGNGADVNATQRDGSTVLHGAVLRRDAELVRLAFRKGAAVGAVDAKGRTAAARAGELGWDEGVALLANHAALPRDNRGSRFALDAERRPIERPDLSDVPRALQGAVTGNSHNRLAKVRELVTPDPRLVFSISNDDELAIEASAHIGHKDLMRFHLDHGAPLSLPTAVSLGDLDAVRFWLDRDATLVHERGAHDFPVMFFCVFGGGSVAAAELLVARGASVDQDSVGTTALHWCVRRDERDLARWLLEHGADPERVGHAWSRDGQTPLQVAVAHGDTRMAALLRAAGARR